MTETQPAFLARHKKRILLGVTAAVVLVLAGYVGLTLTSGRPDVPLRQLLADDAAAPGAGDGFRLDGDFDMGDQPATVQAAVQRVWKRPGGATLREIVYRYGNPLWARISYRTSGPSSNDDYPTVRKVGDPYRGGADRSQVVCGGRSVRHCDAWEYWAQYGQYLVNVRYLGVGAEIDANTFTGYVQPVDRNVTSHLRD